MLKRRLIAALMAATVLLPLVGAGAVAWHLYDHAHHEAATTHDGAAPTAAVVLLHGHDHPDGHPAHAHDLATISGRSPERLVASVLVAAADGASAPPPAARRAVRHAEAPPPPGPALHLLHCVQLT